MYKVQLCSDGNIVSAANHELVKGLADNEFDFRGFDPEELLKEIENAEAQAHYVNSQSIKTPSHHSNKINQTFMYYYDHRVEICKYE